MVGEFVLFDSAPGTRGNPAERAKEGTDQKQAQADAHAAAHFGIDGFVVDRESEIPVPDALCPATESLHNRSLVIQVE